MVHMREGWTSLSTRPSGIDLGPFPWRENRRVAKGRRVGFSAVGASRRPAAELIRDSMAMNPGFERRTGKDRRKCKHPSPKQMCFKGMRQSVRRAEDRRRIVALDWYKPSLFVAIMIVLVLSLSDAMMTLMLTGQGADELNPLMAYYLTLGPRVFLIVKYGITVLSLLLIVLTNQALAAHNRLFAGILPFYVTVMGGVVIWELYLLSVW
jgi:Domain of unknown function (DUF5658)